jgi:hypothetical protein
LSLSLLLVIILLAAGTNRLLLKLLLLLTELPKLEGERRQMLLFAAQAAS